MTVFNVIGLDIVMFSYFFLFVLCIVAIICIPFLIISIATIVKHRKLRKSGVK